NGEVKAGACRDAVDQNVTGAAHAMLAADMRSGQAQVVTKKVAQQQARLDITLVARAVHSHRDALLGHLPSSRLPVLPSGNQSFSAVAGSSPWWVERDRRRDR